MERIKWDEMRLQEETSETLDGGQGQASGDGLDESRRRPVGFLHTYAGRIEVVRG